MENITLEQLYIIKKINELYGRKGFFDKKYNILFGGSISLLSCGLMNRPIGDIDIFTSDEHIYKDLIRDIRGKHAFGRCELSKDKKYNATQIDAKLNQIRRTGLEIYVNSNNANLTKDKPVKLCIFLTHKSNIESHTMYEVHKGLSIPIQQVNHAIHAKILYAQGITPSGEKHKMDIENVYAILNSAFFMISGEELT